MRKSAVEKAGAWKPAKTTNRFPPAPTLPWKSRRKRETPTFPPRRLRLLFCPKEKQRPNPKPRRRRPDGRVALFHKADRSRINRTGQVDLLTTCAADACAGYARDGGLRAAGWVAIGPFERSTPFFSGSEPATLFPIPESAANHMRGN